MPVQLLVVLAMLFTLAGCYPDEKCSGEFVFDDATALCYDCPQDAKFKNGTCECKEGYEYIGLACVLKDGAMPPMQDAGQTDAAAYEGPSCGDYCSFTTTCIGGNALAPIGLPDVVAGLHADDAAACTTSCKEDLGSDEATDPALKCIVDGAPTSMCMDPNPQTGLGNTIMLIGKCCGPNVSSPLCMSICTTFKANASLAPNVPFCP